MTGSIAALVIAIAASGYILASKCLLYKYHIARQNGHRLYLSCLTYGTYALAPALLFTLILSLIIPRVEHNLYISAILTFVIAFLFTAIYNCRPSLREIKKIISKAHETPIHKTFENLKKQFEIDEDRNTHALWEAWREHDIEFICAHALSQFKPVAITLETRKVYVGMVADTIEPSENDSYLSILPLYSGYRDREEHQLRLNHRYKTLIDGLIDDDESIINASADYVIAIPIGRIVTIHIFNPDLYQEVSGHDTDAIGEAYAQ